MTLVFSIWEHSLVAWVELSRPDTGYVDDERFDEPDSSPSNEWSALGIAEKDPRSCPGSGVAMNAGARASCVAVPQSTSLSPPVWKSLLSLRKAISHVGRRHAR